MNQLTRRITSVILVMTMLFTFCAPVYTTNVAESVVDIAENDEGTENAEESQAAEHDSIYTIADDTENAEESKSAEHDSVDGIAGDAEQSKAEEHDSVDTIAGDAEESKAEEHDSVDGIADDAENDGIYAIAGDAELDGIYAIGDDAEHDGIYTVAGDTESAEATRQNEAEKMRSAASTERATVTIYEGKTVTLRVSNATEEVRWSSSKKSVATVENGKVTAVKAGTATVTAQTGNRKVIYTVVVKKVPTMSSTSETLYAGKKVTLKVANAEKVVWSSSNKGVATVANGTVTAVKAGTAKITAKADDKTLTCTVTVNTNYLKNVAASSTKVYNKIASIHCSHGGSSHTYAQMVKSRKVTCGAAVSISLQEAGMMSKGKTITHTDGLWDDSSVVRRKKSSPSRAIKNLGNVKKGTYTVVKAGVPYKKLKAKYQQAGMVYVQDSNICISAGGGQIYSANEGSIQIKNGRYYKTKVSSGYPLRRDILFVIAPKGEL